MTAPKLFAKFAAFCFASYVVITLGQMVPLWANLTSFEAAVIVKHLVVVGIITITILLAPKIGSLCAVAWGSIVPFERYSLLLSELMDGSLFTWQSMGPLDAFRFLLLIFGTSLSAVLAYQLYAGKLKAASA